MATRDDESERSRLIDRTLTTTCYRTPPTKRCSRHRAATRLAAAELRRYVPVMASAVASTDVH